MDLKYFLDYVMYIFLKKSGWYNSECNLGGVNRKN